ncbi:A-kinase anchor protein inhibitor 1 isoform X1 [Choloepus didactylus]|uniref:A-kinase anchor protein inhibitor 1 isoform X1 n=1 Tax=Choloepus didactylus TaxID=27675 RepID=UPI0018A05A60|nr:A-kinase anchor protein inhibitor 1 isoform X1 [Choloepus didactylus]
MFCTGQEKYTSFLQASSTLRKEGKRGEKPGNEPEEVKLQNASKQIVQNAILQAVQQVSQESRQKEDRASSSFHLGVGELTKKHEKK